VSHRNDCPTEWEARSQGARAYERGGSSWGNPYRDDGCEEAERAWRSGFYRAEQRRMEEEAERQFWEEDARRREEEAHFAALESEAPQEPAPEPPPGTEERS
jgi:hypothetical protein